MYMYEIYALYMYVMGRFARPQLSPRSPWTRP
jgi:hypothetical protein